MLYAGQRVTAESWKEIVRPYYLRWFHFPLRGGRPDYFDRPWQYPNAPLTSLPDLLTGDLAAPSFLFLPMSDWHARLQRPQHLATALAVRGHACFFLNPHLGRQFPSVYALDSRPRAGKLDDRIIELHVRLPREPVYHHRLLSDGEGVALAEALGRLAEATGRSLVQILSFPSWGRAALRLRERYGWPIVYDCHDLLGGFPNVSRDVVNAEDDLLRQADYVLFSSVWLRDHYLSRAAIPHSRTSLLRNAVQRRFLDAVRHRGTHNKRTVGYFGALDEWFDIEAVRLAARIHPDVSFSLIGRIEFEPVRSLAELPNVELCGEVTHDRLPHLLADFDAGLIPFEVNDLTRAANPIKLYEYFSAGIPVVSSRLPEVEEYRDLVYLAGNAQEFAACVRAALNENDPTLRARRKAAAAVETWDVRAERLLGIALQVLSGRNQYRST
jgi:glycosyltransferase involved in cell wall biosynthesis